MNTSKLKKSADHGRERAEKRLQDSERRYRTLFETMAQGVVYQDADGRIVSANSAAERILGLSIVQLQGRTSMDPRWHAIRENGSAFPGTEHPAMEALTTGMPVHGVSMGVFHPGTGGYRWILVDAVPECQPGESCPSQVRVTFTDITDRRKAEEALRVSEENYRQLFEAGSDAIVLIDNQSGRILEANTAACLLYGYDRGDILALANTDLSAEPEDTREVTTNTPIAPEQVVTIPLRWHRKKDGTTFPVEITGRFFVRDDRPVHIAAIRDISRRLEAEEEKAKLQAQLVQAQKMESVGRLAGGVAHDFNNMLGVILGHTEMALEQVGAPHPLHADLLEIQKAATRSADLTRQLLAFARRQTITPRVLDLNATVDGMLKMLRRLIGEDIALAWSPGGDLPPVKIDPSQVSQILANLCVNARDAIHGVGTVNIATSTAAFDAVYCADHGDCTPGRYLMLAVSDTGSGMSPEVVAHLFEPFFTTKTLGEGTGLGLATVYGIVKQNGGFINVETAPGQGTTFYIYVPEYTGRPVHSTDDSGASAAQGGRETVLLVEDEPAILSVSTRMLERLGYKVLPASTPAEAIKLAEEYPDDIEVLIADVVMPEMNGRDLAKRLLSLYPNIKHLFMSGYTADVIAHHGVVEDDVHFLQKPFSTNVLATRIREVLARD